MAAPRICTARLASTLSRAATPRIAARTFASKAPSGPARTCLRQTQCPASARRPLSQSAHRQALKTIDQIKARNKGGPFNITAALLFIATAGGLWAYFTYEKERMARKRIAEQTKGVGKPKVGGPFELVDQDGRVFSSNDMLGRYALVYFGFTHCPDICPDELDKMALMYDKVRERCGDVLLPMMITCDPARDSPAVLKEYLAEFHPDFIGLTGSHEQIKDTCKAYRVYFSTPKDVAPGQDYLVDHSIYFYLMGTLASSFCTSSANHCIRRPRGRLCRSHWPQLHRRAGRQGHRRPRQGLGEAAEEGDALGIDCRPCNRRLHCTCMYDYLGRRRGICRTRQTQHCTITDCRLRVSHAKLCHSRTPVIHLLCQQHVSLPDLDHIAMDSSNTTCKNRSSTRST